MRNLENPDIVTKRTKINENTKVQTLADFSRNIGIFGLKTPCMHILVLGDHASMKNEL